MSLDDRLNVASQMVDSQFLEGTNVQFAWDSVSLTSILACARRYQYSIIRGLHPKSPSYAIALVFGILFHKGCEVYHKARANGFDHDEATFITVRYLLDDPATATLPVDAHIEEMKANTDEDDDGITLRNSKIRTRYYLFRSVVWYLEHYKEDQCKTIILPSGAPACELSFRLPVSVEVAGTPIILCGHIDRGIEFNDFLYVSDYKTSKSLTKQFFQMFDLSHQMTGYSIAGSSIFHAETKGAMIDGAALQVGQVQFGRAFTKRTKGQYSEYFDLLGHVAHLAVRHYETDDYPMNTASCYFCEFKDICRTPPEFREPYIRQHYFQKQGWNPLENR